MLERIEDAWRHAERPRAVVKALAALALAFCATTPGFAQGGFSFPAWLQSYPGATPTVSSTDSSAESSYTVDAQPAEVVAHYRKLFEAQGLTFQPNFDGIGTSIRAEAKECDLLILIRRHEDGTFAKIDCVAKTDASAASGSAEGPPAYSVEVMSGKSVKQAASDVAEKEQKPEPDLPPVAINHKPRPASAPPLAWPDWLVPIRGTPLKPKSGVDQTKHNFMSVRYTTDATTVEVFNFYRNLLLAHGYRSMAGKATGQTQSGNQQDVPDHIEGFNYPDGYPGAYTEIQVSMTRGTADGPATISMRFSTSGYKESQVK